MNVPSAVEYLDLGVSFVGIVDCDLFGLSVQPQLQFHVGSSKKAASFLDSYQVYSKVFASATCYVDEAHGEAWWSELN